MDDQLALCRPIHSAYKAQTVRYWKDVLDYLPFEFKVNISFNQTWRVHDKQQYDWKENPHAFIQVLKCH